MWLEQVRSDAWWYILTLDKTHPTSFPEPCPKTHDPRLVISTKEGLARLGNQKKYICVSQSSNHHPFSTNAQRYNIIIILSTTPTHKWYTYYTHNGHSTQRSYKNRSINGYYDVCCIYSCSFHFFLLPLIYYS